MPSFSIYLQLHLRTWGGDINFGCLDSKVDKALIGKEGNFRGFEVGNLENGRERKKEISTSTILSLICCGGELVNPPYEIPNLAT